MLPNRAAAVNGGGMGTGDAAKSGSLVGQYYLLKLSFLIRNANDYDLDSEALWR
jgi:hypothetical protein